jgi:hypothetical protein
MRITRWAIATCIVCVLVALSLSLPNVGTAAPSAHSPEEAGSNLAGCEPGTSCQISADAIPSDSDIECYEGICSPQRTCVGRPITTDTSRAPRTRSGIVPNCGDSARRCQNGHLITASSTLYEGMRCSSAPDDFNICTQSGCQSGVCLQDLPSLRPPDGYACPGAVDSDPCSNPGCRNGECLQNHPLNAAPDGTTCGDSIQSQCTTQSFTCSSGACVSTTTPLDTSVACDLPGARTGACDPAPRCNGNGSCTQGNPIVCPTSTERCKEYVCDKSSPTGCSLRDIVPCPCPTGCESPKTRQDPTTCQCSCPNTCSAPRVQNSVSCACECPTPGAAACLPGQTFNPATCSCQCNTTCPSPQVLNRSTCSCECPAPGAAACSPGQTFNPATCSCQCDTTCPSPQVLNSSTCTCGCPAPGAAGCRAPFTFDSNTCSCSCNISCPAGKVRNDSTCTCECPAPGAAGCSSPSVFDSNTCSCGCPSFTCTAPYVANMDTCGCECGLTSCPVGQKLNTATCACECDRTCPAPQVLNAATCSCQCPSTTCPLGSGFDPTTCQCIACPEAETGCSITKVWRDGSCRKISKCQAMKGAIAGYTTVCQGDGMKPCPADPSQDGSVSTPIPGCMMEYGPEIFTGACEVDSTGTERACQKTCRNGPQRCGGCTGPSRSKCENFECRVGNCTPRPSCCLGFGDEIQPAIHNINCPISCCAEVCGMDIQDLSCSK